MNLLKGTVQQDRFISGDYVVKNTEMRPFPVMFINSHNTELSYSDFAIFRLIFYILAVPHRQQLRKPNHSDQLTATTNRMSVII